MLPEKVIDWLSHPWPVCIPSHYLYLVSKNGKYNSFIFKLVKLVLTNFADIWSCLNNYFVLGDWWENKIPKTAFYYFCIIYNGSTFDIMTRSLSCLFFFFSIEFYDTDLSGKCADVFSRCKRYLCWGLCKTSKHECTNFRIPILVILRTIFWMYNCWY